MSMGMSGWSVQWSPGWVPNEAGMKTPQPAWILSCQSLPLPICEAGKKYRQGTNWEALSAQTPATIQC